MHIKINDSKKFKEYEEDIQKIASSKGGTVQDLKELVEKRMKIKKDFNELKQTFSKQSLSNFAKKFFDVYKVTFGNYFDYEGFEQVQNSDVLKFKVLSKFDNLNPKVIKTDMVIENFVYVDHMGYKSNRRVDFKVLCDKSIDSNKIYTKKEFLELYYSKKLLILDTAYDYTEEQPNTSSDFDELSLSKKSYGLPDWYEQPISLSIIKVDPKIRKMMFAQYNKYAEESKALAKIIKEVLPELSSREKELMDKKNEKFLAQASKEYSIDVKKAKAEYDRVVKKAMKVLEEKENKVQKEEKERQKTVKQLETYIK